MTDDEEQMEIIRVILADDHEAIREGLRNMLKTDECIEVVAEARNGKEAIVQAKTYSPDIILMNAKMPEMDGFEATKQLKNEGIDSQVIILTGRTKEYLIPAIDAGAAGCLDKSVTHEELVMAIRVVHLWRLGLFSPKDDGHFALVKL